MSGKGRVTRKWLYAAWGGAAIIVAAYYGLWRYAAGEMETAVNDWVADQRADGLTVEHGRIKRDGFPFFLRVHIDDPHITSPGIGAWRAERLSLDALPYDLNRLIFSPSGEQWITSEESGEWRFEAEDFRTSIANDKTREWVFSTTIKNAKALGPYGEEAKISSLIFDLAPAADATTTLTLALAASGFTGTTKQREVTVDEFNTALSLTQTHMLSSSQAARDWRGAGGTLQIHGLNAVANEAILSAYGSIRLDNESRPEGSLTATLEKPAGLAKILSASGALGKEESDAAMAGLALAAMAQGGRIEAPIRLQNGAATVAGVKIADLAPID